MDRIRYSANSKGHSAKAYIHVTLERSFILECFEEEPEPDGTFRVFISDSANYHLAAEAVIVNAVHPMGALGRVAEATIKVWDEMAAGAQPSSEQEHSPPVQQP